MKRKYKILSVTIICLLLILFAFIIKKRAFEYGYSAKNDYLYRFDTAYSKIVTVYEKDGFIIIPAIHGGYNTGFLEIAVRPTLAGYFSLPEIRLKQDFTVASQNFECGAKGIRYLNISEFVQKGLRKIKVNCLRCRFASNNFRLIMYKNLNVSNENMVVLSPHPDDAEIAAYGLYFCNKNSFIVTITLGDAGKRKYENFYTTEREHYMKKAELRIWNSITVPLLAGLNPQNIINLGYFDSMLKPMSLNDTFINRSKFIGTDEIRFYRQKNISPFLDSLPGQSTWRSLVDDLKYILQKKQPSIIVTPYPAIDFHLDHKFTTIALFQAMKELNYRNAELWMYTNHYAKPEYYPIGKMGSLITVPPYFRKNPIYFNKLYSHTLDVNMQIDKLFALDAMNDLRLNAEWQTAGELYKTLSKKITNRLYQQEFSYYRRSVRNNELFFVIDSKYIFDNKIYDIIVGETKEIDQNGGPYY
jgi:LmbE family N-acetylglucosaminyl deacetylase